MALYLAFEGAMCQEFIYNPSLTQLPSLDAPTRQGLAQISKGLQKLGQSQPFWNHVLPVFKRQIAMALGEAKMEWPRPLYHADMKLWIGCEAARKGGGGTTTLGCSLLLER